MPKWTPEQTVAIKGSIEKWERIVDGTGKDRYCYNCPLCKIHEDCEGCPVPVLTLDNNGGNLPEDYEGCDDTPYEKWHHHLVNAHKRLPRKVHCPTCKELAQAELDFLREVLKAGE